MVSDIGLNNLIIHLAIACKRIQEENFISLYSEDLLEIMEHKEYEVAAEIVREIENAFKIRFPKSETAYIAIHLLGTKMLNNSNHKAVY
jgi:lichenan operon transcriptional antiterminator